MPAGKLDQRVSLESPTSASDGAGGRVDTWATIGSVWAQVFTRGGQERFSDDRDNATSMHTFRIRYRSDIDERSRIVWRGAAYNIRTVKRCSGRDLYIDLEAERGV